MNYFSCIVGDASEENTEEKILKQLEVLEQVLTKQIQRKKLELKAYTQQYLHLNQHPKNQRQLNQQPNYHQPNRHQPNLHQLNQHQLSQYQQNQIPKKLSRLDKLAMPTNNMLISNVEKYYNLLCVHRLDKMMKMIRENLEYKKHKLNSLRSKYKITLMSLEKEQVKKIHNY